MAEIKKEAHRWLVSGDMTISQVEALLAQSADLATAKSLEIDLAAVSEVDTASISLLFEWLRSAHAHKVKLTFAHFPQNLVSLATLYGVVELIPQNSH
ncbi:MAG: STAS domain-containing protein [Methylophilaceae bacterium]